MTTMTDSNQHSNDTGGAARVGILTYSLFSYLLGVGGLGATILAMAGLLPLGGMVVLTSHGGIAVTINIALLVLFALQHSVMARPAYKQWSNQRLHPALERSTYVLLSGVALAMVVVFWQPLAGTAWHVTGIASWAMWGVFVLGWGYLLAATFAINHFDLFGLRQAWFAFRGETYRPVAFKEGWMYRFSRHPIMLGVLIGVWFTPEMSNTKLMLAIGFSVYIAIGVYFEERDLIKQWGQQYLDYRKRVGALWTLRIKR